MKNSCLLICLFITSVGITFLNCGSGGNDESGGSSSSLSADDLQSMGSATGGVRNPVCASANSAGDVILPQFVMNLPGETSWYASPVIADLDDDGRKELIAAYYSVFIYDGDGTLLDRVDGGTGRI